MLFSATLARKETYKSTWLDEEIVDLLGKTFEIPATYTCQVTPIMPGYDARLDLVADAIYGEEMYEDVLLRLNGPGNPFETVEDQYIIVPNVDSVGEFYVSPSKAWSEATLAAKENKPKAKARNEKRKPNQAVIGDKRFNIDRQSKIIVY